MSTGKRVTQMNKEENRDVLYVVLLFSKFEQIVVDGKTGVVPKALANPVGFFPVFETEESAQAFRRLVGKNAPIEAVAITIVPNENVQTPQPEEVDGLPRKREDDDNKSTKPPKVLNFSDVRKKTLADRKTREGRRP